MSTYKGIQGYTVETLGSDPSATADNEGKVWYNTASNVWKVMATDNGSYTVKTITTS